MKLEDFCEEDEISSRASGAESLPGNPESPKIP